MKKLKKNQKKIVMYAIIAITVLILILGAYLYIKGNMIREGKVIDCGEGTTIYLNENLCWQKSTKPNNAANWEDANTYCEELTLAGHEDWRLPTKEELASIIEKKTSGVSINEEVFSDTVPKHYWSSTLFRDSLYWYVHFELGHEGYSQSFNQGYGTRCVRDILFY